MPVKLVGELSTTAIDIDHAIALSVAEGSTYYTLAYYPEDKTVDGKFRKIEVKLDRKRLEAHYRKGIESVAAC